MTTERIDVLPVMDARIEHLAFERNASDNKDARAVWATLHDEAVKARAAVAELIEAATEMNRLAKGPAGGVSQADKKAIVSRVDAALARVGAP